MKTKTKNRLIIVLLLMLAMVVFFPVANSVARADMQVSESSFQDANLYTRLKKAAKNALVLRSETFNNANYETLTLDGVTTETNNNIISVEDLKLFKFDHTKVLDLTNNNIREISADVLGVGVFPYLEELRVSNNDLMRIDISECNNLKRIYLDRNELTSIDLSDLNATGGYVDLSCNLIESMDDIVFPTQTLTVNTQIDLYNNNISDFESAPNGYTLNLGLQGLSIEKDYLEKSQAITYYKTNDNRKVKTVISGGAEDIVIEDDKMEEDKTVFKLENGDYNVSYYYVDGEEKTISTKTAPVCIGDYKKDYFKYYTYKEFEVIPTTPTYKYIIGDKEYSQYDAVNITKKSLIKVSADDDAKVYYSIGGGDWQEGNEIEITRGGKYIINVKAVSNDGQFESKEVSIFISAAASLQLPSILIAILIIIVAVLIFMVGVPLLRKYVL